MPDTSPIALDALADRVFGVVAWGSPEGTGVIAGTMFLVCVVILQLFYGADSADKVGGGTRRFWDKLLGMK